MPKLFSYIVKQKKIIFFSLLFFVLMGVFLPNLNPVKADWWSTLTGVACGIACPISPIGGFTGGYFTSTAVSAAVWIIKYALLVPLYLTALTSYIAKTLLIWVFNFTSVTPFTSLTNNLAIKSGWPIARNFANVLVLVALIAIALATILRFQDYEAKKLLPKLIIAALLINFSLVICGVFIDASNITITYLLNLDGQSSGANVGQFYSQEILDKTVSDITANSSTSGVNSSAQSPNAATLIGEIIGVIFYQIMSTVVLSLYVFLFLFRVIALWILVIFSPVAFVCYALPGKAQQIWGMWWNNFIQWCVIGIGGACFFYVGETMMKAMVNANTTAVLGSAGIPGAGIAAGGFLGIVTPVLAPIFTMLIPGAFLIIGFFVALQTSAMGANYAISAFNKVKGYVQSGAKLTVKATGGYLANKTGATRLKEATLDGATRIGEWAGVVTKGTANIQQQERLKKNNAAAQTAALDAKGRQSVALGERQGLSGGPTLTEAAKNQRVEAIKQMAEKGELKNLSTDDRKKVMEYGVKNGLSEDIFIKADPDMVEHATKTKQALVDSKKAADLNDAEAILRRKAFSGVDKKEINDMQEEDYIKLAQDKDGGWKSAVALERAAREGKMHKVHDNPVKMNDVIKNAEKYGSSVRKSAEKSNPLLIKANTEGIKKYATDKKVTTTEAEEQMLAEAYRKLNVSDIKDMDKAAFTIEFIENTTAKKIGEAGKDLSKEKLEELRKLLPAIAIRGAAASSLGTTAGDAEADEWEAKYMEIEALIKPK